MSDEPEYVLEEIGIKIPAQRVRDLPLDTIECAAGVRNWVPLQKWAEDNHILWASENLKMLTCGKHCLAVLQPKVVKWEESMWIGRWEMGGERGSLTRDEMESLVQGKVLRKRKGAEPVLSRIRLFKTPKDEKVARLIMECQEANKAAAASTPFSMPMVEQVVARIRQLGRASYVVSDERHSFYQQKIPEEWGQTMAILFEGEIYYPNVLAMGHSHSAKVSHQGCWARVLMRLSKKESMLGVRAEDIKDCPTILTLYGEDGKEVGFMCVYLDNVLVATKLEWLARAWKTRIERNAKVLQTLALKEGQAFLFLEGKVVYLGVEYEYNEELGLLQWRWSTKKREKWERENDQPLDEIAWTPRRVASWTGTLMWRTRIDMVPLFAIRGQMEMVKQAQAWAIKYAKGNHWDHFLDTEEIKGLWECLGRTREELRKGEFNQTRWIEPAAPTVWVAVDACTSIGRGIVFLNERGEAFLRIFIRNTSEEISEDCAFLLEVKVILEMLERAELPRGTTIRCVSDCVGAILCVMKGYSRSPKACDMIEKMYDILWTTESVLQLRWVAGVYMVADNTSRGTSIEEHRRAESWRVLQEREIQLPRPKGRLYKGGNEFGDD